MNRDIKSFQQKIWNYYKKNKRSFPWRETTDPYKILVSEIMLQQTQTLRVIEKYKSFIKAHPDFESLALAPQSEVLKLWQGLGYNRRALYLKRTAEIIKETNTSSLTPEFLQTLPGIGPNTAGAIYVFSYNKPHVFIETNIRRVFIHEFFSKSKTVSDKEIFPLIESALPANDFRNWYYALMDYGASLAGSVPNPNRKSKHYKIQSKFEGSVRQNRGKILKYLLEKPLSLESLKTAFPNPAKFNIALEQLLKEGFVEIKRKKLHIKS